MKTNLTLTFAVLLFVTPSAHAQFIYTTNDGTITITGYIGANDDVEIPSAIDGLPVTQIGPRAFDSFPLTSVTISNGVTSIGDAAFSNCTDLTMITLPNSVTSIGDQVFMACFSLTTFTLPNSVTSIGHDVFADCTGLTSVVIPGSLTNIGDGDFYACLSLTNVTIPNGVTSIGLAAFYNAGLTTVSIPNSVTTIAAMAFAFCTSLTNVFFLGNAPVAGAWTHSIQNEIFVLTGTPATAYYLPGTTGWSTNFGGVPTALWTLPYPLILSGSVGVQTNGFGFSVSWATNASVVVEATPGLKNPSWSPVRTNALDNGVMNFTDGDWTNYPSRFYRVRSQ
jgi:hypothetical protein